MGLPSFRRIAKALGEIGESGFQQEPFRGDETIG
jgi:hypothetical protein